MTIDHARALEILDRLIAFPTISATSNLALIEYVEAILRNANITTHRIPSSCGQKAGLFSQIGPKTDGGICLSAHSDVVPVKGQSWTYPPFKLTRDGDYLYGRGTTDMKGFLASALALAEGAARKTLLRPLSLSISYDEEIGCVGIREMMPSLRKLIGKPRLVIVGEPTSMQIASGHKGKMTFKVICRGESGHSALAPKFVNAIYVAASLVEEIRKLQDTLSQEVRDEDYDIPYSTLHIGKIRGGQALNIVPDRVELEMELRHLPCINADAIRSAINFVAIDVSQKFRGQCEIKIKETNAYPGLNITPNHEAVQEILDISTVKSTKKLAFGTEAGVYAQLGLPTVVIGPGNMTTDGHKADERLALSQLQECDAMLDHVLSLL